MLQRLLTTIEQSAGPVSLDELSRRLDVERSALEPMLDLLERKRLLTGWTNADQYVACHGGACGSSCTGVDGCPFVLGAPRTLTITPRRS